MEITIAEQMHQLFLSCGMGFLLGIYYDVFRVARLIMHSKQRVIFFQDLLFFLSSAVFTFLFALAVMDGRLRLYLFIGEGIGFLAYYFTIGRLVMRFAGTVTAVIVLIWKTFWQLVFLPFRLLFSLINRPALHFYAFIKKRMQKTASILKKALKRIPNVLYNQRKVSGNTSGTSPRVLHMKGKKDEGRRK